MFYCTTVVFIKKNNLKESLDYMQVYLLLDITLMHQEAEP